MTKPDLTKKQWVQLIKRAQLGEPQAFEDICRWKIPSILFICNDILHSWEDAEDATQEILLQMQNNLNSLTTPEAFPAWLNRLSVNTCWTMRRKQMKEPYKNSLDEAGAEVQDFSLEALPAELLETKESQWRVVDAVKSLPYHYRMPIFLYYYEGLKIDEIAEALEITPAAAKHNIQRGRLALKNKLKIKDNHSNNMPMAMIMPAILDNTEMAIAKQHGANVLSSMGISPTPVFSTSRAAMRSGKILGMIAAGTVLTIALITAAVHKDSPDNTPPFYEQAAAASQQAPAQPSPRPSSPASSANVPSGAEPAPQQSQIQTTLVQDQQAPASLVPAISAEGTAIRGRIYLEIPTHEKSSSIWNIPGISVQLYHTDQPDQVLKTTQTMAAPYLGWYMFESLAPGQYFVKPLLPVYLTHQEKQNGFLHGQIPVDAKASQILTLDIPVKQTGSIAGGIVSRHPALENQLSGIAVMLYSDENTLLMQTTTQADGRYLFASPPVLEEKQYILRFTLPENTNIPLGRSSLSIEVSPGEDFVAENVEIKETLPPMVTIAVVGSSASPTPARETAFAIKTTGTKPVSLEWYVEDSGGLVVASGHGKTPGSLLNTLQAGEYFLTVHAADGTDTMFTGQEILYLA